MIEIKSIKGATEVEVSGNPSAIVHEAISVHLALCNLISDVMCMSPESASLFTLQETNKLSKEIKEKGKIIKINGENAL
jgi:hypothetical protein